MRARTGGHQINGDRNYVKKRVSIIYTEAYLVRIDETMMGA